jgi:hypothetical protein
MDDFIVYNINNRLVALGLRPSVPTDQATLTSPDDPADPTPGVFKGIDRL